MAKSMSNCDRVLAAIRCADLPHPDGELLASFLQDSIDAENAACYILRRCSAGGDNLDFTGLLSDWKQLIGASRFQQNAKEARTDEQKSSTRTLFNHGWAKAWSQISRKGMLGGVLLLA
jgi:hypothetical protein